MTTPLIFFSLSGFVMIYLIVHKRMEVSHKRGLILKTLIHKGDVWTHKIYAEIRRTGSFITKRNAVLLLNYCVVMFLRAIVYTSSVIRREVSRVLDRLVRKQEVLTKSGAASAYLKQISEHKNNGNGKGQIEE